MALMTTTLPCLLLAALSAYGLDLSYGNIVRLRQYERQSEKAAEWSSTAAHRLHKTRTTQASGAITLATSILTSLGLIFSGGSSRDPRLAAALVNAAVLAFARVHMGRFWNERNQTRVPFVQKFNEAVQGSEALVQVLGLLAASWGVAGTVWLFV